MDCINFPDRIQYDNGRSTIDPIDSSIISKGIET